MTIPVIYPMGAVTPKPDLLEKLWENAHYVGERKYDGSRYLMRKENGEVRFVSRQKSKTTGFPVDKTENIPHLVWLFQDLPDGTVIDGEIITHDNCTSNEVTSIMGSKPERAVSLQEERGKVLYVAFDLLYYNGHNLMERPFQTRRKGLEELYKKFHLGIHTKLAEIYHMNKEQVYEEIVKGGGEGMIIKNIHAPYTPEKKPKDVWYKVKKYNTYDCVIMGFTEPTRVYSGKELETWMYWAKDIYMNVEFLYRQNYSVEELQAQGYYPVTKPYFNGWCGAVRFGQYKDGELVEVGQTSGIDDDTKHMLSHNPSQYIGQVIEVGAMEQIKSTFALRHPRFLKFRNDKNPEDCILGEV